MFVVTAASNPHFVIALCTLEENIRSGSYTSTLPVTIFHPQATAKSLGAQPIKVSLEIWEKI